MRRAFFWVHLCMGCIAGLVIFVMSVTGVLLAFERQINNWADSRYHSSPGPRHFALESIEGQPTVTVRPDPASPIAVAYGRDNLVYLDAANGRVLGKASEATRGFFSTVERIHRALGTPLRGGWGRPVTGACNLLFLLLVVSGFYLWFPKRWNCQSLRPAVWFRAGVRGRARDWNWHNTIGVWSAVPLFFIVLCSVIMSYAWATNLLYKLTNTTPPPIGDSPQNQRQERKQSNANHPNNGDSPQNGRYLELSKLLTSAGTRSPGWRTISFRMPSATNRTVVFNIDRGNGGQPQKRSQLTLDRATGATLRFEDFASNNAGRRLRLIARFLHTGEVLGLTGQVIAALASLGGAFLVWTGLSLALRRAAAWVRRRKHSGRMAEAEDLSPIST